MAGVRCGAYRRHAPDGGARPLFEIAGSFLAVAFAGKGGLYALLLARLQVVGVTLDFFDDVFLLNLPLETA
jgi:hypothetical protein